MGAADTSGVVSSPAMAAVGGGNVSYDLLGISTDFKYVSEYVYYNAGNEQEIELPYPAFCLTPSPLDSSRGYGIKVEVISETVTSDSASASTTEISYQTSSGALGTDSWKEVEEDSTSMAKAFLLWNRIETVSEGTVVSYNFNGLIAKKIRIKLSNTSNTRVRVTYQAFYKDLIQADTFKGDTGPEYTRTFGKYLLQELDTLKSRTNVLTRNMFGNTKHSNDVLDEDLTGQNMGNYVKYEMHEISTTSGKDMISPAQGAFYPGIVGAADRFKMCKYYTYVGALDETVAQAVISGSAPNGWLFTYTVNNVKVYKDTTDTTFLASNTYYVIDVDGSYRKLVAGTDYTVGNNVADYKEYRLVNEAFFKTNKTYYTRSATTPYTYTVATVTVGAAVTPGTYYENIHPNVYNLTNVPYDPTKGFDGSVNDTSAVITKEMSVILTPENVLQYVGYNGTFTDIPLSSSQSSELTEGTDYEFCNIDLVKTERTYTSQSVYNHIRMLSNTTTDSVTKVGICYHAFGGHVTAQDYKALRQDVTNALSILGEHHLLTVENLDNQTVIQDLIARLRRMENYHQHYAEVEHQVPMSLSTTGYHYINIAYLYDLDWLVKQNTIQELGQFRVASKVQGWAYEFFVTLDMSKAFKLTEDTSAVSTKVYYTFSNGVPTAVTTIPTGANPKSLCWYEATDNDKVLNVKVLGSKGHLGGDASNIDVMNSASKVNLRLCWNYDGKSTGFVLQLGWNFSKYNYDSSSSEWDNDIISVVNKSGVTSKWQLYNCPLETVTHTDAPLLEYNHAVYSSTATIAGQTYQSTVPYFKPIDEYLYYLTGSKYVKTGVTYYKKNDSSEFVQVSTTEAPVGTEVSTLGFSLYERSAYRTRYRRVTVAAGTTIKASDGTYIVNESSSVNDTSFSFPDPTYTWISTDANSHSAMQQFETDDGAILWIGNLDMATYSFGPNTAVTPVVLHMSCMDAATRSVFKLERVDRLTLTFYDRKVGRLFTKDMPMVYESSACFGDVLFFFEDMCGLSIKLYKDATIAAYLASVEIGLGTSSYLNHRFDLRQINAHYN